MNDVTRTSKEQRLRDLIQRAGYCIDGIQTEDWRVVMNDLMAVLQRTSHEPPAVQSEWPLITRIKADIVANCFENREWSAESEDHCATLDLLSEALEALKERAAQPPANRPTYFEHVLSLLDAETRCDFRGYVERLERAAQPPSDEFTLLRQLVALDVPTTGSDRIDAYFHEAKRYAAEGLQQMGSSETKGESHG